MFDYNFFDPYSHRGRPKNTKKLLLITGLIAAGMGIFVYPIYNYLQLQKAEEEINAMKYKVESEVVRNKVENLEVKKEKTASLKNTLQAYEVLEKSVQEERLTDDLLLSTITNKLPEGVFVKAITIRGKRVSMEAFANSKADIALLQYKLRQQDHFKDIFTPNIADVNGRMQFSVTFSIEGGVEDDVK